MLLIQNLKVDTVQGKKEVLVIDTSVIHVQLPAFLVENVDGILIE